MNHFYKLSGVSVLLVLLMGSLTAQITAPYAFPEKIPNGFVRPEDESYAYLMSLSHKGYTEEEWQNICKAYLENLNSEILSGDVYAGWDEAENYINQVFQKIIPASLKADKRPRIYLARDEAYNAFTYMDGTIFLNIGVLAEAPNEAAIAEILGHEITHYANQDVRKGFEDRILNKTKKVKHQKIIPLDSLGKVKNAHKDRRRESVCDSMSAIYATTAGYSIDGVLSSYYYIARVVENPAFKRKHLTFVHTDSMGRNTCDMEKILADHPETLERMNAIQAMRLPKGGRNYLVDSVKFKILQRLARMEQLNILLEEGSYKYCMEKAFLYHLFEPNNDFYIYTLLEAIRRQIYLEPPYKKYTFIAHEYPSLYPSKISVLSNLLYIARDSAIYNQIEAKEYINSHAFTTYADAFKYFQSIAIQRKIMESYLTIAMYHSDSVSKYGVYLSKYIESPDSKLKPYAREYEKTKNDININEQNKSTLVIVPRFETYEMRKDVIREYYDKSFEFHQEKDLCNVINARYKDKHAITLSALLGTDFKQTVHYRRFINLAGRFGDIQGYNESKNYFVVAPELWMELNQGQYKAIQVILAKSLYFSSPYDRPVIMSCCEFPIIGHKYVYHLESIRLDSKLQAGEVPTYSKGVEKKMTVTHLASTVYKAIKAK